MQKRCALAVSVRTLTVEKRTNMYVPVLKSVIVSSRPIHWSTLVEKLEVKLAKDSMVTCRSYLLSHSNRNHNYDPRHVGRAFLPCVSFDTHACTLARRFPHALLSSSKRTGGLYKDLKHTPVISSTKAYYVTTLRDFSKEMSTFHRTSRGHLLSFHDRKYLLAILCDCLLDGNIRTPRIFSHPPGKQWSVR